MAHYTAVTRRYNITDTQNISNDWTISLNFERAASIQVSVRGTSHCTVIISNIAVNL